MDKSVVTAKGQVVIPSRLRRKYGIKKGTQVSVYERGGEIILQPLTDEFMLLKPPAIGKKFPVVYML